MVEEKIPFYKPSITTREIKAVAKVLKSGWLTMGPRTQEFEEKFAKCADSRYAIAVSSCTAALHLSLLSLDIEPDEEVVTTPFTFCSTINVIIHVGAKPVLIDIKKETFNINETKIEEKINEKTKAIIPVHYAGISCEMDEILRIAKEHEVYVIEDAAHALGSEYRGRKIGSIGDLTCFSFYATKNITTGEGGMITTDNEELAERLRILRLHGMEKHAWKRYSEKGSWYYEVKEVGWKYNMTDIQASLGLVQLERLDELNEQRRRIAKIYNEKLLKIKGLKTVTIPDYVKSSHHLYPLIVEPDEFGKTRDDLIKHLTEQGISTSVHFIPIYRHPYYSKSFNISEFENCEWAYYRELSLPLYPDMTEAQVNYVIQKIKESME